MRKNQVCLLLSIILPIIIILADFSILEVSAAAENSNATKKNFDLAPFIWTVGIVGGCIAITLSYVSWRKYKGEEKKKVRKDKTID
ncbi:sporulation protein YpjB [Virgibacillus oceani]